MKGRIDTMNATTFTGGMTVHSPKYVEQSEGSQGSAQTASHPSPRDLQLNALAGKLYRFHSFRVLDVDGKPVGLVDWIWSDEASGQGEFIGVQLRWLRGTARAVPTRGTQVDTRTSTVRLAYRKDQIKRAARFSIDREITADQKHGIYSYFHPERAVVSSLPVAESLAA